MPAKKRVYRFLQRALPDDLSLVASVRKNAEYRLLDFPHEGNLESFGNQRKGFHVGRLGTANEFLTVPEVASLLRVVEKTIYTMVQHGEIPAFKVRGQWRFAREDLRAWIDGRKTGAIKGNAVVKNLPAKREVAHD